MKLVILAGGKGKRLGLTNIPKPMVPICGKPLLYHQIELAKKYGIHEVYILSGFLSDSIINYFGDGERIGVKIIHITEKEPLGTAGAINQLRTLINEPFLVFNGDNLIELNLEKFIAFYNQNQSIASLIVQPTSYPMDCDILSLNEDKTLESIYTRPHPPDIQYFNIVNGGIFIFHPSIFSYITDKPANIEKDIIPKLLNAGEKITTYKTSEYIFDIGSPKRLKKAIKDYKLRKINKNKLDNYQKAIFIDRDGVINKEINHLNNPSDLNLLPKVVDAIKLINESDYLAIVITNQSAVARGLMSVNTLNEIHKKLESILGNQNVYLDEIFYCPHHPGLEIQGNKNEFQIDCECRKPKPGMIKAAIHKFNIDIKSSFIIGDKSVDIQTGDNIGLNTILVKTGYGGSDKLYSAIPNQIFDNLFSSVKYIISK